MQSYLQLFMTSGAAKEGKRLCFRAVGGNPPLCASQRGFPPPSIRKNKNLPQKFSAKSLTNGGRRRSVRLRRFGKDAGARERRGKVKKLLDRRREIFIKANFAVAESFAGRRKEFFGKTKKEVDKPPREA